MMLYEELRNAYEGLTNAISALQALYEAGYGDESLMNDITDLMNKAEALAETMKAIEGRN